MTRVDVPPVTRRKLLGTLFAGAGLARTGFLLSVTVTTLVAKELLGSATFAGVPVALATVGIAVGTRPMSRLMDRTGRRTGMVVGAAVAAAGALLAAVAANVDGFVLLLVALFVFGLGTSGDRLSRYAAADVSAPGQTGRSISLVVWAGTIGAIVGPALLDPSERLATSLGLDGLSGAYLVAALVVGGSGLLAWLLLRPDPLTFAPGEADGGDGSRTSLRELLGGGTVRFALAALAIGQIMMVVIMVMTPIHIRDAGGSLAAVGAVISAHTIGMFAVSPLSGWLSDRIGTSRMVLAGLFLLLAASIGAAFAGGSDQALLIATLFVLGLGWNFEFVAGSALVVEATPAAQRVRVQGIADSIVWISAAVASVVSGILLALGGYTLVSMMAATLVVVPGAAWLTRGGEAPGSPVATRDSLRVVAEEPHGE